MCSEPDQLNADGAVLKFHLENEDEFLVHLSVCLKAKRHTKGTLYANIGEIFGLL